MAHADPMPKATAHKGIALKYFGSRLGRRQRNLLLGNCTNNLWSPKRFRRLLVDGIEVKQGAARRIECPQNFVFFQLNDAFISSH